LTRVLKLQLGLVYIFGYQSLWVVSAIIGVAPVENGRRGQARINVWALLRMPMRGAASRAGQRDRFSALR
jgi:hypothetical protein